VEETGVHWELTDKPPNATCDRLSKRLLSLTLKEVRRMGMVDADDVATASLYVCMHILSGCSEDKHVQADIYRGASDYFAAIAKQMMSDA
jgi:hypothetical protein